jgi:hypothetical protein
MGLIPWKRPQEIACAARSAIAMVSVASPRFPVGQ